MAWWVGALVQAAPLVYSAFTQQDTYSQQAGYDSAYAAANSMSIRQAGEFNAATIAAAGRANAEMALAAASATNQNMQLITDYNSERAMFLGDYNAKLLEEEALYLLDQTDVSLSQMKRQHQYAIGRIEVAHGASGAIMNQDTSKVVLDDIRNQQETEEFIVRRGADIQYKKLMDKAAMSRWSGLEEANSMQLESRIAQSNSTINAALGASQALTQAGIDATTTRYNASVQADQVFQQGMLSSEQNEFSGNSAFWSNMFMAGTSLASSYINNQANTTSTNQLNSLLET